MADKWPLANGAWSNAANWNDGTKPQAGDTVYADGKTVTIDENATVATVTTATRSGGTPGGGFVLADGVALVAAVVAGAYTCVTYLGASTAAIVGDVSGYQSASSSNKYGVQHSGAGTLTITGNLYGGQGIGNHAVYCDASGGRW